jgi:predicted dithiol-disulfide oxidoreductase (DUF899 family)
MKHDIVSYEEWVRSRKALMSWEKQHTKDRDALARARRNLPWTLVEKAYRFMTTEGEQTLAELFAGKRQLFVKHLMQGPGQDWQCVGCSLEIDHMIGLLPHFESHDVAYVVTARAPIDELEAVRSRMDWPVKMASAFQTDFNYDMHVSFRPEDLKTGRAEYNFEPYRGDSAELSGNSVFWRDENGAIYLTYQLFSRGGEDAMGIFRLFDMLPLGREENGPDHSLTDWAKLRNDYGDTRHADASGAVRRK